MPNLKSKFLLEFPWLYKFEALDVVRDGSERTSAKNVKKNLAHEAAYNCTERFCVIVDGNVTAVMPLIRSMLFFFQKSAKEINSKHCVKACSGKHTEVFRNTKKFLGNNVCSDCTRNHQQQCRRRPYGK